MTDKLTHFNAEGAAVMVDVGAKAETARAATARARVVMRPDTLALIRQGNARKGGAARCCRRVRLRSSVRVRLQFLP